MLFCRLWFFTVIYRNLQTARFAVNIAGVCDCECSELFFKHEIRFRIFFLFSVIGLGLTELIMWLGTDILKWDYRWVKILATAIVMIFNFITKKLTISKN